MDRPAIAPDLLFYLFQQPSRATQLTDREWGSLIAQLRVSELSASFAHRLQHHNLYEGLPRAIKRHLDSALVIANANYKTVCNEARLLDQQISKIHTPCIMLKGSAYLLTHNSAAAGRVLNDIDILVERGQIELLEQHLRWYGWGANHNSGYDDRYYRRWMHEIPPLRHQKRGTVLDIHHSITPLTSRIRTDSSLLFHYGVKLDDYENIYTFTPEVMVIHSATHLFLEGEFHHGSRDLLDLHALLSDLSPSQWASLVDIAEKLALQRPLFYAITLSQILMHTLVPEPVVSAISRSAPPRLFRKMLVGLFSLALQPNHPDAAQPLTSVAHFLLYLRGHYLRMPLHLLIPHLIRKTWRRKHYLDR